MVYGQPPGEYNQRYGQWGQPPQQPYGTQQYMYPPPPIPPPMPPPVAEDPRFPPPENLRKPRDYDYLPSKFHTEGTTFYSSSHVGIGKNIGIGLMFYVIVAIAVGLGVFISILASGSGMLSIALLSGMMAMMMGPVFALVIGIVQGKLADSNGDALISGGVANVIGYIILMFIIISFLAAAFSIKYPSEDTDDEEDESSVDVNFGELIVQFIGILLPSGIIGALGAFFSSKYIYH